MDSFFFQQPAINGPIQITPLDSHPIQSLYALSRLDPAMPNPVSLEVWRRQGYKVYSPGTVGSIHEYVPTALFLVAVRLEHPALDPDPERLAMKAYILEEVHAGKLWQATVRYMVKAVVAMQRDIDLLWKNYPDFPR